MPSEKSITPIGSNWRHGYYGTSTYNSWAAMIQRCTNQAHNRYYRYGARGITVCERWLEFKNFLADMKEKPDPSFSIERRDNDRDYCLENCYWGTDAQQRHNRSDNHWLTFNGETLCLNDWASRVGMAHNAILRRLQRGWSVEDALTKPLRVTKLTGRPRLLATDSEQ